MLRKDLNNCWISVLFSSSSMRNNYVVLGISVVFDTGMNFSLLESLFVTS